MTLPELRDAVELTEAQLQGKQAELRRAESKHAIANRQWERTKALRARAGVSQGEVDEAADNVQVAQAEIDAKKAEVLESEVRLKHAKRRAEVEEARLKREIERAKSRLDWSENMFKKGFVSKLAYDADKAAYDELMIQLDPKYVPAAPAPDDQTRKEKEGPAAKLAVKLVGEKARFAGQPIDYRISLSNPGTTPTKYVNTVAVLPRQGGKLLAVPPGAKFDASNRRLIWTIPPLEPGQVVELAFNYGTSTHGVYQATVEAISGEARAGDTLKTDVAGIVTLDLQVTQTARVVDSGKTNLL